MKRLLFTFALLFAFLLCGCSSGNDPLDYQNSAANAEVVIRTDGTVARALLSLGAPKPDGSPRDAKITFSSPDSLSGIVVTRSDGSVVISLGSLSLPSDVSDGFMSIVDLFSIKGTLSSAELCRLDGKKTTHITVKDTDVTYEVYISENSLPRRIVKDRLTVDVVWFEYAK